MNIWAFMDIPTWICIYIYNVWGCNLLPVGSLAQARDAVEISWEYHGDIDVLRDMYIYIYTHITYIYRHIYIYI